jgi:hypothetical protein
VGFTTTNNGGLRNQAGLHHPEVNQFFREDKDRLNKWILYQGEGFGVGVWKS